MSIVREPFSDNNEAAERTAAPPNRRTPSNGGQMPFDTAHTHTGTRRMPIKRPKTYLARAVGSVTGPGNCDKIRSASDLDISAQLTLSMVNVK